MKNLFEFFVCFADKFQKDFFKESIEEIPDDFTSPSLLFSDHSTNFGMAATKRMVGIDKSKHLQSHLLI